MRSLAARLAAPCIALAGAALAGLPYNVSIAYQQNAKDYYLQAWYGDGNLYVGPNVPPSIKTVFDFTVPNIRADLLYVEPTTPGARLPDPTFLVVNNAPGASDPVFFAHSAADLTEDDRLFWFRYGNVLFPILQDNSIQNYFHLDEVPGTPGTYLVRWREGVLAAVSSKDKTAMVNVELIAYTPPS
ncbi:hypothetical protein JX265_013848 [Neoarthrinium moseri]|uniref:Uncharacterized protein n=1 Tax=Neoarthrinium moseri TaxID=1658444 RepID=A0A9P9W7X8_9PEZI|nr:hypothetical protein JX266_013949 [Neoarthrinium moseri]KAI1848292.1 hypothetical protein JX265_013848 [Neoarthrinium moseri]